MVGRNINISNRNRVSGRDRLQVFLEGFTAIIDLAFGPDGSFYVLQFATGPGLSGPGALIRVAPDGTRTIIASEGLFNPTSVVLGRPDDDDGESDDDGDEGEVNEAHGRHHERHRRLVFYISNCGTCAGTGEVIRIERSSGVSRLNR